MIIDRLEFADRYVALHPQFGEAFRFLRRYDASTAIPGRHNLAEQADDESDAPFLIIEKAEGRGQDAARVEYHRRYIDIQFVAEGCERIGWIPTGLCKDPAGNFDAEKDIGFFQDAAQTWLEIPAGCFAIFFPEDGHAPLAGTGSVHKVVVKIPQSPEQILRDLQNELAISGELHPEQTAKIENSIAEVRTAMQDRERASGGLAEQLRELAQEFEVSHPRLTHTVGRVADALAQIGI